MNRNCFTRYLIEIPESEPQKTKGKHGDFGEFTLVRHCQTWQYRPQSIGSITDETALKKLRRHDAQSFKKGLKLVVCRHSALMKTGKG